MLCSVSLLKRLNITITITIAIAIANAVITDVDKLA
jgi:hypothetical protein